MPPFFTLLPESIWSEVNRRIRVEPTLRDLLDQCEDDARASLATTCQTVEMWRPGIVGKVYLQVKGQERRSKGQQLPELAQATLAALNLKDRLQATQHFASLVLDAKNSLRDWSIPLVCLYAIIPNPSILIKSLIDHELTALAARILIVNETPASLITNYQLLINSYPTAIKVSLANHFSLKGSPEVARVLAPKQAKGTGRLNLPGDPGRPAFGAPRSRRSTRPYFSQRLFGATHLALARHRVITHARHRSHTAPRPSRPRSQRSRLGPRRLPRSARHAPQSRSSSHLHRRSTGDDGRHTKRAGRARRPNFRSFAKHFGSFRPSHPRPSSPPPACITRQAMLIWRVIC
ncbi:MAG: hypothetical protein HZB17_08505 [Chloroflexi bacterium]|nr:hypothetical protein [Chloroflexota bacterium]